MEYFEGNAILQVGCGLGLIHPLERGTPIGIDPPGAELSEYVDSRAAEKITAVGESLPFEKDQFDSVLCVNVIDYCLNRTHVINEIRRVLRPGGELFLLVNPFSVPKMVRDQLDYIDQPHPPHFSHEQLVDFLTGSEFAIASERISDVSIDRRSLLTYLKQQQRSISMG